jgi:hypothetical protein
VAWTERYVTAAATGGGDGLAEGTAWTPTEAAANVASGQRVNIKAGTYARTAQLQWSNNGPYLIQGYTTTPGDGGRPIFDGGVVGASYSIFRFFCNRASMADVEFRNNGASGSAAGLDINSNDGVFSRVVVHDVRGSGFSVVGLGAMDECEAYACNQSNTSGQGGFLFSFACQVKRCIAHDNTGSNNCGLLQSGGIAAWDQCVADSNGLHGFALNVTTAVLTRCDAYANGGSGIGTVSGGITALYAENCNLVKNGAYGISPGGSPNLGYVRNCGFGSGTQANTSGQTNGIGNIEVSGSVTYAANVTPWADPANGDFRVSLATAKGAGRGTFTQTATSYTGTVAYPDIGAAQHFEAVAPTDYPAPADVQSGVSYNFGALVGTLALPATADVRLGTGYGASGIEFTGTLLVPTYAVSGTTTDIESAVYRHLAATAAVTALVGDRIYPNEADPDAPRPLIVFVLQGTEQTRSLLGGLDFQRHTVSVTADAIHKDDAKAVTLAVRAAMDNVTFDGIKRSYWADESAGETNDGYESVQTFTVIQ